MFDYQEARNLTHKARQSQISDVLEQIKAAAILGHYMLQVPKLRPYTVSQLKDRGFAVTKSSSVGTEIRWD